MLARLLRTVSLVGVVPGLAIVCVTGLGRSNSALAGDGFPPNGAWVYGSQPHGVRSTTAVSRGHHFGNRAFRTHHFGRTAYRLRSSVAFRNYYPATSWSYGYYAAGRPWIAPYPSGPFAYFYHSGFSGSHLTYRTYIPLNPIISRVPYCSVYSPLGVSPPGSFQVHVAPNVFSGHANSSSYSVGKPVVELDDSKLDDGGESIESEAVMPNLMPRPSTKRRASDEDATRLTSQQASYADLDNSQPVPDQLLRVADALLKLGGTREAAQAYAQLSLRFGASDLLFGRRLVAQVAAGDFEQATVVVDSAQLAEFQIRRNDLPEGSLQELGINPQEAKALTDRLAQFADRQPVDPSELRTLASWLTLSGDEERAQRFFDYATQVAEGES